jgi:hypothetical protein
VRWAAHVARDMRNACRMLVIKPEGKKRFEGRFLLKRILEIGLDVWAGFILTQYRVPCRVSMNTVINLWVS